MHTTNFGLRALLSLPLVLVMVFSVTAAPPSTESVHGPDNHDQLTNSALHSLPLEDVIRMHQSGRDGNFFPSQVISTISPVVVRQNDPAGPKYQEAIGYTFLLNSPKYPGLCQLDDGTLVLTLTAALSGEMDIRETGEYPGTYVDENTRTDVILYSKDDGMSWSQPRRIPGYRTTPMNLGGNRLMIRGWNSKIDVPEAFRFWFSEDGGETWSEEEKVPALPDGRPVNTDVSPKMLIEGDTIRFVFYTSGVPGNFRTETIIWPYNHATHQWDKPYFFPDEWRESARCSEGSLTRAANGNLVGCFRSHRPGIPSPFDGWRGIVTAYSSDDGKTWSEPAVHSLYGHVHHTLLPFPDGRVLMTYAVRIGELDGRTYHGHDAVLSHDNGQTWDWDHRYILFRGGVAHSQHSPRSVLLNDGRVFTIYMHPVSYSWRDEKAKGNLIAISNVSAVIWQP